ncbi:hypothetical protein [Pleionea sp. CnH1-48]|uniref:hypothetical protein n=1 Tax=Pleionea sp. CnH1-48 TaxID=2954494 RepID=UPI002096F56C|nr:hypothetical protein [Pleionea sp. CnH1-48]MCO7223507.1 hypothetical protein [Pleionea sp. CnH1-48]
MKVKVLNIFSVAILLAGCSGVQQKRIFHTQTLNANGLYDEQQQNFSLIIKDEEVAAFSRPGIHGNIGFKTLSVSKAKAVVSFADSLSKSSFEILSHELVSREKKATSYTGEHSNLFSRYVNPSKCNEMAIKSKLPLDVQETLSFRMEACEDFIEVITKNNQHKCSIDLTSFAKAHTNKTGSPEWPLSTAFDYALQESSGNVILRENNWRYVRSGEITLYELSCTEKVKQYEISTRGLGDEFFIVKVSHYGEPALIIRYDDWKKNRIVKLDGEILYDGPILMRSFHNELFLPDEGYIYSFDVKRKEQQNTSSFYLDIHRLTYQRDGFVSQTVEFPLPSR